MPSRLAKLEAEVSSIKKRNARVEADKAWETSLTRKAIVFLATYVCITLLLFVMRIPDPLINALVPSIAFVLSTATLNFAKEWWKKNSYGG